MNPRPEVRRCVPPSPRIERLSFHRFNRYLQANSNRVFEKILQTPPIHANRRSPVFLYTVLCRGNLNAYLLACKSLLRFLHPSRRPAVVVQSDGSLTSADRLVLSRHIPGIGILDSRPSLELIRSALRSVPGLPELLPVYSEAPRTKVLYLKLLNVICRFTGRRIVQMDSDILFIRRPEFVIDWLNEPACDAFYCPGGSNLVGRFADLDPPSSSVRISRFNSGLLGLRRVHDVDALARVLTAIDRRRGEFFEHWEAEQTVWCLLLRSLADTVCLGDLRAGYVGNGWRTYERMKNEAVMAHFVGTTRFQGMSYILLADEIIAELLSIDIS